MTTENKELAPRKKFTLTKHEAKLEKVRYSKRMPKVRKNKNGEDMPVESSGDENVLKATLGMYIDTTDTDILDCFAVNEPFKFLYENKTIPALTFSSQLMNYELTVNESLEIELATLKDFKATLYSDKDGKTFIRLYFSVVCVIDGRMAALINEFWKEKVIVSCEPSSHPEY